MTKRSTAAEEKLSAEEVAEYLASHPEFFEGQSQLVSQLRVPHDATGNAVSLIEKQVDILRKQNVQLERKLVDLIEVARANDAAVERIHQLAIGMMDADDLPDLLHTLQDRLRHRFGADAVAMLLFRGEKDAVEFGPVRRIERDDTDMNEFQNILKNSQPIVGRLRPRQLEILFGEEAPRIGSAALIPLGDQASYGLLAIAAHSEDQFGPTLGTTFLVRIAELLTLALRRYV